MECKINPAQLMEFQFGSIDREGRAAVEDHLRQCPDCLSEFFLLKRDVEGAPHIELRPNPPIKSSILRAFARSTQDLALARPKRFILGGLVAAAAAIFLLLYSQHSHQTAEHKDDAAPQAETIRSLDEKVDSGGSNPGHINII